MSEENASALKEKQLGNNAYEKRDYPKAISHYEKAISLNPTEMVFHSNLAAVYLETKELEKCIRSCETALEVGRENGADSKLVEKVLRRLARALRNMGNLMVAKTVLEKAMSEHGTREAKLALFEVEKELKLKAEENSKGDKMDKAMEKKSFAEKLAQLGFLNMKEKEHSDRKKGMKEDSEEDKHVIRFEVLEGGSCTECNCGNAKNMKTPTTGFGSRDDPIPYVDLSDVKRSVNMMLDVNEMVVPEDRKSISVVFDYPLKDEFVFELESPRGKGFTRGELVTAIGNKYKEIYKEEEETSRLTVESISARSVRLGGADLNLINRANTDGKYGIWGHDLEDLALEDVIFCPEEKRYYLNIGS